MPRELVQDRAAEADLIGIWVYTFETWSEAQADRYLDALEHGIGRLVEDPHHRDPGATSYARATGRSGSSTTSSSTPSPTLSFASGGRSTR